MLDERLSLFILAYESPTFSAAAAQLPMSPQGFTKSIRKLERDLNAPLFVTDERGVRKPTPFADELYQFAKRQQVETERLKASFDRIKSNENTVKTP